MVDTPGLLHMKRLCAGHSGLVHRFCSWKEQAMPQRQGSDSHLERRPAPRARSLYWIWVGGRGPTRLDLAAVW